MQDRNDYQAAMAILGTLYRHGQCHESGLAAGHGGYETVRRILSRAEACGWVNDWREAGGWVQITPSGSEIARARLTLHDAAEEWAATTYDCEVG